MAAKQTSQFAAFLPVPELLVVLLFKSNNNQYWKVILMTIYLSVLNTNPLNNRLKKVRLTFKTLTDFQVKPPTPKIKIETIFYSDKFLETFEKSG